MPAMTINHVIQAGLALTPTTRANTNTAVNGSGIDWADSGAKGRFLGFLVAAQTAAATATVTLEIQGSNTTVGGTYVALKEHNGTTNLQFPNAAMISTGALGTGGFVFGSVDLERSDYKHHRLSLTAVTGGTVTNLHAMYVITHKRRVEPQGDLTDQILALQHLSA